MIRQPSRIPFTKEGFENIKKEYQDLLDSRPQAVANLKEARDMGDLSENSLYRGCRARLSSIDSNLRRLNGLIKLAYIASKPTIEIVGIGSKVAVNDGKKEIIFYIVGRYEGDPLKGKISNVSPVGYAMMGKRVGDTIKVNIPSGQANYKISKINNN